MLATRRHVRYATVAASIVIAAAFAACGGGDDDVAVDTVVVAIGATGSSDVESEDSASGEEDPSGSTHDVPSVEEVGRADFTHTIVAGDFLRSIADAYDVEIDDIVGANEWGVDGREHLLLPGDVIYLPADAVMPLETTVAAADPVAVTSAEPGDQAAAPGSEPSSVCADGQMFDTYEVVAGDTLGALAARFDVQLWQLESANRYDVAENPPFGPGQIWVPCVAAWPQGVVFANPDDASCSDGSNQGFYTVPLGAESPSIAATFGVTEAELQAENPGFEIWWSDPSSFVINVCMAWFV